MSRRTRTTAILLVLLLALVVVAPALPVVREAVIDRALGALEGSGITVTYRSSSGNAWRAITLHDVQVQGVGADVAVETLELGYFLPSLLGGELPIDVLVHGATGTLDLKQVLDAGLGDAGGGAAGPVSVRLRRIDLQDIGVDIAQVPFDLPGASISNLSVTQDGTAADLAGVITTTDGSASLQGRYDALTGTFTGTVVQADAAIARHWWSGIAGGSVSGTLTVRGSAIDGDFDLVDGSVDYQGLNATGVSGPVTMRYPVITAELAGDALGGRVEATGVVNVAARRWEANGGGTVALEDGAAWLTRTLAPDGLPIDIQGLVDVDLTVVGWADVDSHPWIVKAIVDAHPHIPDFCSGLRDAIVGSGGVSGANATSFLSGVNIDTAFMAASGFSLQNGFTSGTYSECELKQEVLRRASSVIMLMDSSKCGKSLPYTFGTLKDIDVLVSDDNLPDEIMAAAAENGVTVI